ncbi:MAG: SDR family NAD(P)-dependent oxidoreductase [Thermoleophilia bacterium]|nr:SDR family NAD(P)-dependent oxidoreductase [Thermoleophilia bacterium]
MTPDDATLYGSRVLVTGASRGYGAAIARALAARGARLLLTATQESRLVRVADDCRAAGADTTAMTLHLSSPDSIDALATAVAAAVPRLEGVVMNAGVLGPTGPLDACDPDQVARAIQVDMLGQARLLTRLSPVIADGAGVVLVTSGAAGRPGYAGYALGKAGLEALGLMLREEWAHRGIRVVAINPGPVRTDMRAQAHPQEDPATVPPPSERVAPVLAVLAGEDPGPRVQAAEWGLS